MAEFNLNPKIRNFAGDSVSSGETYTKSLSLLDGLNEPISLVRNDPDNEGEFIRPVMFVKLYNRFFNGGYRIDNCITVNNEEIGRITVQLEASDLRYANSMYRYEVLGDWPDVGRKSYGAGEISVRYPQETPGALFY